MNPTTNLMVQIVLLAWVAFAGYVAKFRRDLLKHCWFMRAAIVGLLVSLFLAMLPSFIAYARVGFRVPVFYTAMYVHAALGVVVVGTWLYVNLVQTGVIKTSRRLVVPMRLAATLWVLSFITGLFMYLYTRI